MPLRPYQVTAVAAVEQAWADGKKCVCLVAPTGAGKSEMAAAILAEAKAPLALVHTRVLYGQTVRRFPGVAVGTIQGLLAKGVAGDRRRARLTRYDAVFIDEVHHLASALWREVMPLLLGKRLFGATATPVRADGTPLGDVCDHLVVAATYTQLLREGYLCRCDVSRSDISRKVQKSQKVRPDGVKSYLEKARREDGSWRPGIYFDGTIEQCQEAVDAFNLTGVRAELVCCDTKANDRQRIFDAYNAGQLDMLASPMALSEGFDAPRAEVCVLRRMAQHLGTYLQIVGRVLRPFPGKERALLIDCSGASEPGHHGLPTNDRVYSLDGKGISNEEPEPEEDEEEDEEEPLPPPDPARTIEAKFNLIRDTLLGRYVDLCEEARVSGYKQGWVFHRFTEMTGLQPPRSFSAKFASTCLHCRKRMKLGEEMFWGGTSVVWHPHCWFAQLDAEALSIVPDQLPAFTPRAPAPVADMDDIPF